MTFSQSLLYVLQKAPLWWIRFWLYPLELKENIEENQGLEFITAILSGLFWGGILGIVFWLQTGNLHLIWIVMSFFFLNNKNVTNILIIILFLLPTLVFMMASPYTPYLNVFLPLIISIVSIRFLNSILTKKIIGTNGSSVEITLFNFFLFGWGILSIIREAHISSNVLSLLSEIIALIMIGITIATILFFIFEASKKLETGYYFFGKKDDINNIGESISDSFTLFFSIILMSPFLKFTLSDISLIISVLIISSLGKMFKEIFRENTNNDHNKEQTKLTMNRNYFLARCFLLFIFNGLLFKPIAILITIFILQTGLIFYPFLLLICWHQSKISVLKKTSLNNIFIFKWRFFPYPFPYLERFFNRTIKLYGVKNMLALMSLSQKHSLQEKVIGRVACKIAANPELGLFLCGTTAMVTNKDAILQLALTGNIGQTIAILTSKLVSKNLKKHKLQLFFVTYPPSNKKNYDQFEKIHNNSIKERVKYAIELIDKNLHFNQAKEFKQLLLTLKNYAEIKNISELDNLRHQLKVENVDIEWLQQGWQLIPIFETILKQLETYRQLKDSNSRRALLNYVIQQIETKNKEENWEGIAEYWSNIGKEIHQHWIKVLKTAIEENRELLQIRVEIPEQYFQANGQLQQLQLRVYNESNIIAKRLQSQILNPENGLHFTTFKQDFNLALESFTYQELILTFSCEQAGDYEINGEIIAEELDGTTCRAPFNARLHVGKMGKPYQSPPFSLYITGESLGDDEHFIGRQSLIRQLKDFWKQPHGKPAVLLVGQRRIGKTSLLNKLQRIGLEECQLIPIYLNAQAWQSEHEFLTVFIREITKKLSISSIILPETNFRPDFDNFLTQTLISKLNNKRILLMVDETEDLFEERKQYGTLAGYLRNIMQSHDYPVLLLFCGAHKLKALAKHRDSVFFNTTNEFTVSYLTQSESFEVLQKPAKDYLEFSNIALEESYRLTHGQPLLLQMLGSAVINHFNDQIDNEQSRSNYVDYNDIQQAVDKLIKTKDNKAFTDHWEGSELETQSVLSVFAAKSDEVNRPHLDIESIEQLLKEYKFDLNRNKINEILTHLTEEEILQRGELTYQFCVPLYRRWIKARYAPHFVKERFS